MPNTDFIATTVTATASFQQLSTLLASAGVDVNEDAVMGNSGYIRNLSTSINLLVGTGTSAPTSLYSTVAPASAILFNAGLNTNTTWIASASSTVVVDFVAGAAAYQASPSGIAISSNAIPKGSGTTLINSSMTDNGTTVTTTAGIRSSSTSGIGYTTGAGANVIQGTSRTTAVTANTPCGTITLFSAAGTSTPTSFTVNNSIVTITDTIILHQRSGTDLYQVFPTNVANGSFRVTFIDLNGTTTEQPELRFSVIKSVQA